MTRIDSRLPRYQRLRDQIAAEIAAQVWKPGEAIPAESELAVQYGLALGTVRRAMDVLAADGLVERVHGRGTFVRRPSFDKSLLRFLRLQAGGPDKIPESRILDRSVEPLPEGVAQALALEPGDQGIHMVRQRLIDHQVRMAEDIWLSKARFAPLLAVPSEDMGALLYPAYERLCGQSVAFAEETLFVEIVGADHANVVGIAPGAAVVVIDRLARGYDGTPLEWRRSRAPAATFRYHVDIR